MMQLQTEEYLPVGSGGNTGDGYTGTMEATDPTGNKILVQYDKGTLTSQIPDGTVVHTAGGDYVYYAPRAQGTLADMKGNLDTTYYAARQQRINEIDNATEQGVQQLREAEKTAQQQFQTQRDQIDAQEGRALDNQALYAEVRGDRGGIGKSQYDSIQNTAAANRRQVNLAQTQLAADTAQKIQQLRMQGEYEKSDQLLALTQSYLAELNALGKWAAEHQLNEQQLEAEIIKWQDSHDLQVGQLIGSYYGIPTLAAQQQEQERREFVYNAVQILMEKGITLTDSQLEAAGLTEAERKLILEIMGQSNAGDSVIGSSQDYEAIANRAGKFERDVDAFSYLLEMVQWHEDDPQRGITDKEMWYIYKYMGHIVPTTYNEFVAATGRGDLIEYKTEEDFSRNSSRTPYPRESYQEYLWRIFLMLARKEIM